MPDRMILTLLMGLLLAASVRADPADVECEQQRAGYPQRISRLAHPSDTGRYLGNYVGGGCPWPRRAEPPTAHEGTWGWDYTGGCFRRHVLLGWWHDRRYQGGIGSYRTIFPHILPALHSQHGETSSGQEH
jgi:hypothetical protein